MTQSPTISVVLSMVTIEPCSTTSRTRSPPSPMSTNKFLDLHLLDVRRIEEMDRLGRRLKRPAVLVPVGAVHDDPLRLEHSRVKATHRLKAQESVFVDVLNQESDLVHMRGQHHPGAAIAALDPNHVAQGINGHFINKGPHLIDDDGPNRIFVTGHARALHKGV